MKIKALVVVLAALIGRAAPGSDAAAALYNQGNGFYGRGEFDRAVEYYERALRSGAVNSDLYYNSGNAWHRQGDIGRAVLLWSRAERLSPRDPDLRANLALVRKEIAKSLPAQDQSPVTQASRAFRDLGPARTWALVLSSSAWGFWILLSLVMVTAGKKIRTALSLLLALFIILLTVSAAGYLSRRHWETEPSAVVLARGVSARSGPGEGFTSVFSLAPGARVLLKECRSGFCSVELPPGMVGWVDEKAMEKI